MSQLNLFSQPEGQLTDAERRQKLLDEFLAAKGAYLAGVKQKRAKKSRLDSISLLDGNDRASQLSFGHTTQIQPYPKGTFPPIGGIEKVQQILQSARSADWIGLDFEFSPSTGKITIIGVSTLEECAGAKWTPECKEWLLNALDRGVFLVGHWVLGADKPILENFIGEKTPASRWIDSMGLHFLTYQCLCKLPGKENDGEGSLGFMSLSHATAIHTDIPPGYKSCVGVGCLGELDNQSPCPSHNPTAYCAIDAFVGLVVATNAAKLMDRAHIPWACYEKWHELTLRCIHAENQGFRVNKSFIDNFDAQIEEKKKQFFPQKGKKWEIFNPKSSKQTLEWFAGHGIHLRDAVGKPSTDKEVVLRTFEGRLANYGIQDFEEFEKAEDIKLTYPDEMLYKLFLYKDAGKGMKPWFDEKFLKFHDGAWWVHPRFNTTGASTTRLSSSAPNFQNITSRGWGLDVKKGLLARNDKSHVMGCDASQLEHRIIIYECGEKPPEGDFFKWLLGRADGKFEKAAERMHGVGRDIAKRVAHACLTEGHEVLTPAGWVPIESWAGQEIAQYRTDGTIFFDKPKDYFVYDAPEKIIRFEGRGLRTDCTHTHKFPVVSTGTWKSKKYRRVFDATAMTLLDYLKKFAHDTIPVSGILDSPGEEIYTDEEIKKAVAIQADANLVRGKYARFKVKKDRKINRLKELFSTANFRTTKDNCLYFTQKFESPLLNASKEFTWEFLKLSQRQRLIFLEEILLWDGTKSGSRKSYCNTNIQSLKVVQTLAHISGMQSLWRQNSRGGYAKERSKPCFTISFNRRQNARIGCLSVTETINDLKVYCFTTDTGYFLTRFKDTISVTGNSNYAEGFKTLTKDRLREAHTVAQRDAGALRVFEDWTYCGEIVVFTGANLAQTLFGDKSYESRRKALELQFDIYFNAVPFVHEWHRRLSKDIERGYATLRTGHRLVLLDSPLKNFKAGAAFIGQGGGAQYVQDKMIQSVRPWAAQVHDEIIWDTIPADWSDGDCLSFAEFLWKTDTPSFPGLLIPWKVKRGPSWGECKEILPPKAAKE